LIVAGRVQGVGFRWFAVGLAEELGLSGWARNREDETVELEAEGSEQALDAFVARLKTENPAARVDRIEQETIAPKGDRGFRIAR
jgi:acylphosphatase